MAVVSHIDGVNRKIYLNSGVTEFNPVEDIYKEVRAMVANTESLKHYWWFIDAKGNEDKGGGKATPRYAILLRGTRIIPFDETGDIEVTGEVINDDGATTTVDTSSLTNKKDIKYRPPVSEIIYINTGSSGDINVGGVGSG